MLLIKNAEVPASGGGRCDLLLGGGRILRMEADIRISRKYCEILDARMRGVAVAAAPGPLDLSPDGTRLRIHGGEPIVFRSDDHIEAIRKLVDGFYAGRRVPIRELTDHGTLHRHFGGVKWKLLKPYLTSAKGAWGFDL